MRDITLTGSFVAIVTPFRQHELDLPALRQLVERLIDAGTDGLVPCGTTGESVTLSETERELVVRTVLEVNRGRVPVIVGTGSNDTQRSIEATRRAKELGADAALVVTPYYNKPNQEGIFRHFEAIAAAVDFPLVAYNVPGRTCCRIELSTLARLDTIPNVIATKDATGELAFASETLMKAPGLRLLSGDDATSFPFMMLGGHGVISVVANVAPKMMADMCRACREGELETARRLHFALMPLSKGLFCDTNPIPVKALLHLQGLIANELRLPLLPMSGAALERFAAELGPLSQWS
ncbi:MAG: 4-hydroxy-tetrahydrodipicolinate synthase [Myxococcota bacterium]|jgi:4-hydroxy-tetrahydrodipicolinate synthase|nr:4-hydroxy-tetrahydrodipicolinate synthase [Myxococcota bacterium]